MKKRRKYRINYLEGTLLLPTELIICSVYSVKRVTWAFFIHMINSPKILKENGGISILLSSM